MSKIASQKKVTNTIDSAGETTPARQRAAALARLSGLFGEITECLSWGSIDGPAKARGLALECLVYAQGSWATAEQLFGLGEALLKHAPKLLTVDIFSRDVDHKSDVIHGPTAHMVAQLAALGAECITLSLVLGAPAPTRGSEGWICLDTSLRRAA